MKKLINDEGINQYQAVKDAYEKAKELLKEPGKNKDTLLELLNTFATNQEGTSWLSIEVGENELNTLYAKMAVVTNQAYWAQYPACKKAYEKAEELLKEPKKNRKGLLDILLELERNKKGIKYLAEEFGEAAYRETLRKIENESARGYILKKEGAYDGIVYLPDIACMIEIVSPSLAGIRLQGGVYALRDCLAVRKVQQADEDNDPNMVGKIIVARLEPKMAAALITYAESKLNNFPKEGNAETGNLLEDIVELIRYRGVR
jgi:hypothetical protein